MSLSLLLFLLPLICQGWLAGIIFRRGLYRRFPLFLGYTVFALCAELLRRVAPKHEWAYFYVYWTTEALYALLGFLAIYEAFHHVFKYFYLIWWWFKYLLPIAGVVMAAVSLIEGIFYPPVQFPPGLASIFVAEMAVRCLQLGVFCLFIGLVWFWSMPWQNYEMGIALGFSISGSGSFITYLLLSKFGTSLVAALKFLPPVAYIIAVVVWLVSFARPEPPDPFAGLVSPLSPEQVTALLQRWSRQLKGTIEKCLAISL